MKGRLKYTTFIVVLLALQFNSTLCFGQNVKVGLRVENQEVFLGENFITQVIVSGAKADETPVFEKTAAVDIEYEGMRDYSQRTTREINGKVTRTVNYQFIYQYKVKISDKSVKKLPKAVATVGGKRYLTNSVGMTVKEAAETDEFKLRIQGNRKTVYVGEPMLITTRWYLRQNIKGFEFSLPETTSFEVYPATDEVLQKETLKAEILGEDTKINRTTGMLDGQEFTVFEFQKLVIFKEPGRQVLGPLTVQLKAIVGRRRSRDLFDLGGRDILKKHRIPSNQISVTVEELPPAPADFTGLVGRPEIQVQTDQKRVRVGDPIKLTVKARCNSPLGRIVLPNLQTQSLSKRFKVSKPESPGEIQGSWKVQNWTIRAKDASLKAIPKLSISYFDPRTGQFSRIESPEIPIEVQKSAAVNLDSLDTAPGNPESYTLKPSDLGISHNIVDHSALVNQSSNWRRMLFSWTSFFAMLPLLLYGLVLIYQFFELQPWRTAEQKRIGRIFANANQELVKLNQEPPEMLASELGKTLRSLVAGLADRSAESFSTQDAIGWIDQSHNTLEPIIPILHACDASQFGGQALERDCLDQSRRILKNARANS